MLLQEAIFVSLAIARTHIQWELLHKHVASSAVDNDALLLTCDLNDHHFWLTHLA